MNCLTSKILPYIIKEPYRLFFPMGVLIGLYGVGQWFLYGIGIKSGYSNVEHASIQIQSFLFCFVIGFMLTAMPKFMLSPDCSAREFLYFFILGCANFWNQLTHHWIAVNVGFVLGIMGLYIFIMSRSSNRFAPLPAEFILLFYSFWLGLLGAGAEIAFQMGLIPAWGALMGKEMLQLGFMLAVVLGIGGFMGPRLLGYYAGGRVELDPVKKENARKKSLLFYHCVGVILVLSFVPTPLGWPQVGALLRAIVVTVSLILSTKIYKPLPSRTVFTLLLWASFWFVILGSWGQFLPSQSHMVSKHLVFIGGFSLMAFVVATKVIFSHAGLEARFHHPIYPLWGLGLFFFASLLLRVVADFFPAHYFKFLIGSSLAWICAVVFWLVTVFPKVFVLGERVSCLNRQKICCPSVQ